MTSYVLQLFAPLVRYLKGSAVEQITRRQDRIARTVDVNTAKNIETINTEIATLRAYAGATFQRIAGLVNTGALTTRQNQALVKARTQIEAAIDQLDAVI
jgi:hypothetical protein